MQGHTKNGSTVLSLAVHTDRQKNKEDERRKDGRTDGHTHTNRLTFIVTNIDQRRN